MPKLKRKVVSGSMLPVSKKVFDPGVAASAYLGLKAQNEKIVADMNNLKDQLRDHIEEFGTVTADEHVEMTVEYAGRRTKLMLTCRKSAEAKPNAMQVIKKKFPGLVGELIETAEIFRQDRLETLILEGELSEADVKKLIEVNKTYAFTIKKAK